MAAAISKVINETTSVAALATKLVLTEGLLAAMGRANDELSTEVDRLLKERWSSGKSALEWAALKLEKEMPPCAYNFVPGRLRAMATTLV